MSAERERARLPRYSSTGLSVGPAVVATVRLALAGLSNREIAARRRCSLHTVNNQLKLFYDVARQEIADEAFWKPLTTQTLVRQALPQIWERMAPALSHLVPDGEPLIPAPRPATVAAALAAVPAPRCRELWGRGPLIDALCHTLTAPQAFRMVLLAAFGGHGKTECARAVAERLLSEARFQRLLWIDLRNGQHPATGAAADALASVDRLSRAGLARTMLSRLACSSEDDLRRQLSAEATLIILDGLETIERNERGAAVDALHSWLGTGPSRALLTSRVDVVAPYIERPPFLGLDLPASEAMLRGEAALLPQAAQLRNAPAGIIERIWKLTLGMPLALHQVIAQCQHFELRQVVAHLEQAHAQGSDDAFYASLCRPAWDGLSPAAQALLVYLAVATRAPQTSAQLQGISPAAGITFDQATLHGALAELSTWFLVQRTLPEDGDAPPTYAIHPTTRAFVLGRAMRERWSVELGTDMDRLMEAATHKHAELVALAIGAPGGEVGRNMTLFSQTVHDRTLARAIPDVLHVMQFHHERGHHAPVLWYWEALSGYLWYFGHYPEFAECDEYALAAARQVVVSEPDADQRLPAIILAELGYAAMELDEPERAAGYFRDAECQLRELGDGSELVRVLRYQAALQLRQGAFAEAERFCRAALMQLDSSEESGQEQPTLVAGDRRAILRSPIHNLVGAIYLAQRRHDAARREIVRALRIARRIGGDNRYWALGPALNLGRVHQQRGRFAVAARYYQRCLIGTEDGSNPDMRADTFTALASLAAQQGDPHLAQQYAQQAATIYAVMGKHGAATRTLQMFDPP